MNTNEYIINKLNSYTTLSYLMNHMKDHGGCYLAGGALTCLASGKQDQINDFDIYFPNKEACAEAIRWMKEEDPHVGYISSKAITYVLKDEPEMQFVYDAYYPTARSIFENYDFTINMIAYDPVAGEIVTHEDFWLNLGQRFLSINTKTKYPILSLLRLEKYKSRGYHTSRNEMLKLALAIMKLNITSWESAQAQLGNTYGFNIADFTDCDREEFSIDALIRRIIKIHDGEPLPKQREYLYPVHVVDLVVLGQPLKAVEINGNKTYLDDYADNYSSEADQLIADGVLKLEMVDISTILEDSYYFASTKDLEVGKSYSAKEFTSYGDRTIQLSKLEDLIIPQYLYKDDYYIYKVAVDQENIKSLNNNAPVVTDVTITDLLCRGFDLNDLKEGKPVTLRKNAKCKAGSYTAEGWAHKVEGPEMQKQIKLVRDTVGNFIKDHVIISSKTPAYGHTTFKGVVLTDGESITPHHILMYVDDYNLCFGGSITLKENGTFTGSYYTD